MIYMNYQIDNINFELLNNINFVNENINFFLEFIKYFKNIKIFNDF